MNVFGVKAGLLAMMIKLEVHARPEDQAMGGPAEVEHTDLIAFVNVLAFVHCYLAGRDFGHSYGQDAHQPYIRVIRFDKDKSPCRHFRDVALRIIRARRVEAF